MRKMVLAGIFALSASTALAQTGTAPEPAAEPAAPAAPQAAAPETAAPQTAAPQTAAPRTATPAAPAETDPAAGQQADAAGPANLCQELLAFMKAPPPEPAAPAAAPAKPAAAPKEQAAPAQQGASALAGTTASGAAASPQPDGEPNSAQQVTGQDGVATDAPDPSNEKVAAGSVANAPQKDSRAAPLPPADVTSTPKESVMTVAQAEELAAANDIAVCHDTAREMRVAGVAMPPPLIALAALDLQYQQAAEPQSPAPATDAPAAGQGEAAPEAAAPAPANAD
jgi:hypothetical protein